MKSATDIINLVLIRMSKKPDVNFTNKIYNQWLSEARNELLRENFEELLKIKLYERLLHERLLHENL